MISFRHGAENEDWAAIHALLRRAFAFMEGRIDPPSSLNRMTEADLAAAAKRGPVFLAEHHGVVIACAFGRAEGRALYLGKIAVDASFRGAGVARNLLEHAARRAAQEGFDALELETRVELVENQTTFRRLGFVEVTRTRHEGYSRPTSVTMRRRLDHGVMRDVPDEIHFEK